MADRCDVCNSLRVQVSATLWFCPNAIPTNPLPVVRNALSPEGIAIHTALQEMDDADPYGIL